MTEVHGDRELAARLRATLGRHHDVAAIAVVWVLARKSDGGDKAAAAPADAPRVQVMAADAALPDAPVDALADASIDAPPDAAVPQTELEKKLLLIKKMYEEGKLTKDEYDQYRKKLLEKM